MYAAQLSETPADVGEAERLKECGNTLVVFQKDDTLLLNFSWFLADAVVHLGGASTDVHVLQGRAFRVTDEELLIYDLGDVFADCSGSPGHLVLVEEFAISIPGGGGRCVRAFNGGIVVGTGCTLLRYGYDPLRVESSVQLRAEVVAIAEVVEGQTCALCADGAVCDVSGRAVAVSGARGLIWAGDGFIATQTRIFTVSPGKTSSFELSALFGVECQFSAAAVMDFGTEGQTALVLQVITNNGFLSAAFDATAINREAMLQLPQFEAGPIAADENTFTMRISPVEVLFSHLYLSAEQETNALLDGPLVWGSQEPAQGSLLSRYHPAIERKMQTIAVKKAEQERNSQVIMYHTPKSTISNQIPFGELQKMKKLAVQRSKEEVGKINSELQAELGQRLLAKPATLFKTEISTETVVTLHSFANGIAAQTSNKALCLYAVQNRAFLPQNTISFQREPEFVSLHRDAELALAGASGPSGDLSVYDISGKVLASLQRPFEAASYLFPSFERESLLAGVSGRELLYYYYKGGNLISLARFRLELGISAFKTFTLARSSHILVGFAGFDASSLQNPYCALFDSDKCRFAFEILVDKAPFENSIERFFVQDYSDYSTSLFGLETSSGVAIYDVRRTSPVCITAGRRVEFVGDETLFLGGSGEFFDLRAMKSVKVQGLPVGNISALGTKKGCFYAIAHELGYFAAFE